MNGQSAAPTLEATPALDAESGVSLISSALGGVVLLLTLLTTAQIALVLRDRTIAAAASSRAAAELAIGRNEIEVADDLHRLLGDNTTVDVSADGSDVTVRIRRRTRKIVPSSLWDNYLVSELISTERFERVV